MTDADLKPEPRIAPDGVPWCAQAACRHYGPATSMSGYPKCTLTDTVTINKVCRPAVRAMHAELVQLRARVAAGGGGG